MRRVGLREVLVFALEDFREVAEGDFALAHGLDDGLSDFDVAVSVARAAVVDARRTVILPEPEVDFDDVLDVDEVAALLAVFYRHAVDVAPAAEEMGLARLVNLVVELIENRSHLALVMFLRAVDVEVLEADNLAVSFGHDLTDVAVEGEFRESVWIQCILALVALAEAVFAAAVRRSGRSVHERDAVLQAEMQQRLRIFVVRAHHEVDIVLHRVGAGTFMEDGVDVRAIEVIVLDGLKEIILVLVVDELQAAQVLVVRAVLEVIDNEDIRAATAVKFLDDVAADKTGTTRYDNHEKFLPVYVRVFELALFFAFPFEHLHELFAADGVRAEFGDDDARGEVGHVGTVSGAHAARKAHGEDGDDRIAGTGDIEDFLCLGRDMDNLVIADEGQALFRARDDDIANLEFAHNVVRGLLDGLVLVADGL